MRDVTSGCGLGKRQRGLTCIAVALNERGTPPDKIYAEEVLDMLEQAVTKDPDAMGIQTWLRRITTIEGPLSRLA